jgi:hypothetical protein
MSAAPAGAVRIADPEGLRIELAAAGADTAAMRFVPMPFSGGAIAPLKWEPKWR